MAAPVFLQREVAELLRVRKDLDYEAWHTRRSGRSGSQRCAVMTGVIAPGEIGNSEIEVSFELEVHRHHATGSHNILLKAKVPPRPMEGLVRYDLHDGAHENPKWCRPPEIIQPQTPHRHVYSERGERERDTWDCCAEILDIENPSGEKLLSAFLDDLNIHFTDNNSPNDLFEWMNRAD